MENQNSSCSEEFEMFSFENSGMNVIESFYQSHWPNHIFNYNQTQVSNFLGVHAQFRSLYVQYCGVVAASVDVERLWSSVGNMFNFKRNKLHSSTIATEIFLKANSKIKINTDAPCPDFLQQKFTAFDFDSAQVIIFPEENQIEVEPNVDDDVSVLDEDVRLELGSSEDSLEDSFSDDSLTSANPFWNQSNAPKNFSNFVRNFMENDQSSNEVATKRFRKRRIEDQNLEEFALKRVKLSEKFVKWIPKLGDRVLIPFAEDCTCQKGNTYYAERMIDEFHFSHKIDIIECACANVWFEGTVTSDLCSDEINGVFVMGYHVDFVDATDYHIEYDTEAHKKQWIFLGSV